MTFETTLSRQILEQVLMQYFLLQKQKELLSITVRNVLFPQFTFHFSSLFSLNLPSLTAEVLAPLPARLCSSSTWNSVGVLLEDFPHQSFWNMFLEFSAHIHSEWGFPIVLPGEILSSCHFKYGRKHGTCKVQMQAVIKLARRGGDTSAMCWFLCSLKLCVDDFFWTLTQVFLVEFQSSILTLETAVDKIV